MFTNETYTFTENTLKAESVHVNILFTNEEHDRKILCSQMKNMTIRQNNHVHMNIIIMFTNETYTFTENTLKAESVQVNILCSQM